jgi:hypothetical protein
MTLNRPPTCSLSPMIPNNASHLRLTAAAGTKLAVASFGIPQLRGLFVPIAWWSLTVVYTPKGLFPHAASLPQAFAHWGRFSTAASRRSLGSVSVPMCRVNLSVPVPVIALVSFYLTNKLIGHGPLLARQAPKGPRLWPPCRMTLWSHRVLPAVSRSYPRAKGTLPMHYSPFRRSTSLHKQACFSVRARLACLIHAASVRSEPGSNPSLDFRSIPVTMFRDRGFVRVRIDLGAGPLRGGPTSVLWQAKLHLPKAYTQNPFL